MLTDCQEGDDLEEQVVALGLVEVAVLAGLGRGLGLCEVHAICTANIAGKILVLEVVFLPLR